MFRDSYFVLRPTSCRRSKLGRGYLAALKKIVRPTFRVYALASIQSIHHHAIVLSFFELAVVAS